MTKKSTIVYASRIEMTEKSTIVYASRIEMTKKSTIVYASRIEMTKKSIIHGSLILMTKKSMQQALYRVGYGSTIFYRIPSPKFASYSEALLL